MIVYWINPFCIKEVSELWSKLWSDLWCADITLETRFRLKVNLFMHDSTFVAKLQYRGSVKELGYKG
jgi:hypothetical protein